MIGSEALPRVTAAVTASPVDPATASRPRPRLGPPRRRRHRHRHRRRRPLSSSRRSTADRARPRGPARPGRRPAPGRPLLRLPRRRHRRARRPRADPPLRHRHRSSSTSPPAAPRAIADDSPRPASRSSSSTCPASPTPPAQLTFPDGMDASVIKAGVSGDLVDVTNQSGDEAETRPRPRARRQRTSGTSAKDEQVDAQLASYVHATPGQGVRPRDRPRLRLPRQEAARARQHPRRVQRLLRRRLDQLLRRRRGCENTGRIADIVYHEYGHSVHQQSLIPGVGAFEGALSEGISDYLSGTITNDSGLGRGFFVDAPDGPLREMNPDGSEARWPEDISGNDVHDDRPHHRRHLVGPARRPRRQARRGGRHRPHRHDLVRVDPPRRRHPDHVPRGPAHRRRRRRPQQRHPQQLRDQPRLPRPRPARPRRQRLDRLRSAPPSPDGIPVTLAIAGKPKECVDLVPVERRVLRWRGSAATRSRRLPMTLADQELRRPPPDRAGRHRPRVSDRRQPPRRHQPSTSRSTSPTPGTRSTSGRGHRAVLQRLRGPRGRRGLGQLGGAWQQGAPHGPGRRPHRRLRRQRDLRRQPRRHLQAQVQQHPHQPPDPHRRLQEGPPAVPPLARRRGRPLRPGHDHRQRPQRVAQRRQREGRRQQRPAPRPRVALPRHRHHPRHQGRQRPGRLPAPLRPGPRARRLEHRRILRRRRQRRRRPPVRQRQGRGRRVLRRRQPGVRRRLQRRAASSTEQPNTPTTGEPSESGGASAGDSDSGDSTAIPSTPATSSTTTAAAAAAATTARTLAPLALGLLVLGLRRRRR
jgi:hypothetical protein